MTLGATRRPRDVSRPTVVLRRGEVDVASWPLPCGDADIGVVDQLARLQLEAKRLGCTIRVRNVCAELCELLELSGLEDVVVADD